MKEKLSPLFLLASVGFTVCLIASNLFAAKIIHIFGLDLPGAVLIFPLSYILNDCVCEVWGFKKMRLVIWLAFAMNFFVVFSGQLLVWLPAAVFWNGAEHFNYMFSLAPRIAVGSLLAFLAGSGLNAFVMSRMKVLDKGRRFGLRAIVSSLVGEGADSLVFIPIAFWGLPAEALLTMMLSQVSFKVVYEIIVLPLTAAVVRKVKAYEGVDVFDKNISYNPFRITDL